MSESKNFSYETFDAGRDEQGAVVVKPVQIQTNGQLVIFKSHAAFLDILGYSKTYTQTAHYKSKYSDETPQKLWNRVENARQRLEQLMATYTPTIDRETGMKSYRHSKIIVCPMGYIPPALKEHVSIDPNQIDTGTKSNGHANDPAPVASQSPSPTLNELLAARISEEIEKLVAECEVNEGKHAAELLRASITGVTISVTSVSGSTDSWLIKHFDDRLFQNNGNYNLPVYYNMH